MVLAVPTAPAAVPRPELRVRSPPQSAGHGAVLPGCDLPQQVGATAGGYTSWPPSATQPAPVPANLPTSAVSKTLRKGLKTALTNEFHTDGSGGAGGANLLAKPLAGDW